jgi:hypothetical protein
MYSNVPAQQVTPGPEMYSNVPDEQVTLGPNLQYVDHKATPDAKMGFFLNERLLGKRIAPVIHEIHGNFPSFDLLEEDNANISDQTYSSVSLLYC